MSIEAPNCSPVCVPYAATVIKELYTPTSEEAAFEALKIELGPANGAPVFGNEKTSTLPT